MSRPKYSHHVRHFTRAVADAAELVWERTAFEERYGKRGFHFEEGSNEAEAWLDILATDAARWRMRRRDGDLEG